MLRFAGRRHTFLCSNATTAIGIGQTIDAWFPDSRATYRYPYEQVSHTAVEPTRGWWASLRRGENASMFFGVSRQGSARAVSIPLLLVLGGCSGTDIGYPRVSDAVSCPDLDIGAPTAGSLASAGGPGGGGGPNGGAPTTSIVAGASGTVAGGAPGTAGSAAIGGAPVTSPFAWPASYDAAAAPADGHHNPGSSCMSSPCHGTKVPFAFGGTVYGADGVTGAPNVEVGISDGALTVTAYSASNGNIWLPSSVGAINFGSAQIAIRNGKGERVKPATVARGSACNGGGCHGATLRLLEP